MEFFISTIIALGIVLGFFAIPIVLSHVLVKLFSYMFKGDDNE